MNLVDNDQIQKKLLLLEQKLNQITSITDEEKEILSLNLDILRCLSKSTYDLLDSIKI